MFHLRLKTKLVLAITTMVVALVATLSSIYISQLVKQRVDEAFQNGEFVASELFQSTREALETDLSDATLNLNDEKVLQSAIEESLQTDAGLNSLLQSIVGYSPTIYDVSVVDNSGRAIVHSDGNMIGKQVPRREDFASVRNGGFWKQVKVVYGASKVYDMQLPLHRDGQPFATIRVGISSVFLKGSLQPKLNSAFLLSGSAILFSVLLAVAVSTLAFRPLAEISKKLDQMTAGTAVPAAPALPVKGRDEYGVVNTKIDRLGQQMRDVKEVFSTLKENLDQIMSNLQEGVMLFTRDEKAVLVSSSIEAFLHKSRAELLGKTAQEIFSESPHIGRIVLEAFERHESIAQVEVVTAPSEDGAGANRVQIALDFIEENGERIGALLTLRDSESVHRIEDELELSRRLAAVGRLTSGVAHEVKNPINAIVVHLEVLRQKLKELDPDTRRHMDVIGTEIRRLDRVVQTLVDFTRPMDLRLAEVDLRRLLDEVINLASPDAEKHGVHVLRDISEESLPVKIDSDLVKQAVLNVMINGMQAMGNGGNLTIRAHVVEGEAQVEIADQGGGIPKEIREKIFNLYFTTKSGGSGIGLPMAYRVMQLHSGSMEFHSVEGEGTTFRLRFPLTVSATESARELASGSATPAITGVRVASVASESPESEDVDARK